MRKKIFAPLSVLLISACTIGPDYVKPPVDTPPSFKEAGEWVACSPDDMVDRGAWWSVFHDPILNALEKQIDISNQNLKVAEANYRAALASADVTRAGLFPTVAIDGSGTRNGTNGGSTSTNLNSNVTTTTTPTTTGIHTRAVTSYNLSADASWSVDLWGRIRREVESEQETAQASAAEIASARLSAQALLATDYYSLRVQDELQRLLNRTTADDQKILRIIKNQYSVGVAAESDVLQAQTQLESVSASSINVAIERAQLEHAIAVLVGQAPSEFSIPEAKTVGDVPMIPVSVPSVILQRRPDIASAERQMAAANAQIGVAQAAYFPDLTLSASFGTESTELGHLFSAAAELWSFGASATETLIDFGARDAATEEARANFESSLATYRQTVLTALQNVEDNLVAQRILVKQEKAQTLATNDARKSTQISLNQYKEGIVPYNTVLSAQITQLADEQTSLTIRGDRLAASVALIEAIGGGWDNSQLPSMGPTGFFPIPNPISYDPDPVPHDKVSP